MKILNLFFITASSLVSFLAHGSDSGKSVEYICKDFATRSGYVLKASEMGEPSDILLQKKNPDNGTLIASAIYKNIGKNIITRHSDTGVTHYDLHTAYKGHPDIVDLPRGLFFEYLQTDSLEFPYFILVKDGYTVVKLDCEQFISNTAE